MSETLLTRSCHLFACPSTTFLMVRKCHLATDVHCCPWSAPLISSGISFQHDRRRLSPLAGEHELTERFSLPQRQIALLQGFWQCRRVALISDRQSRPCFGMLRDLVEVTRLVGKDPDHLMDMQTSRRSLHQQIAG